MLHWHSFHIAVRCKVVIPSPVDEKQDAEEPWNKEHPVLGHPVVMKLLPQRKHGSNDGNEDHDGCTLEDVNVATLCLVFKGSEHDENRYEDAY